MVYYKDRKEDMIQDEPLNFTVQRYRRYLNEALAFNDTHMRVHYCHYGAQPCPQCPALYALQDVLGDIDWIIGKLHKKYRLEIYRHIKKNDTWTWNIRTIPDSGN